MAEGLVNYTRLDDSDEQIFTTQGRPISSDDEIKIVDEQYREVPEGEVGMLATRGPYTFCGYYQSPEHNSQVFDKDNYYYSGDLVQRTPDGNLRVVGRIKDQINRGGEKIASEEIENLFFYIRKLCTQLWSQLLMNNSVKRVVPLLFLVILNLKLLCSDAISWSWVLHNTNFQTRSN